MLTHHFFKGLVHGLFLVLVEHEGVGVPIYSKIGKGDQLRQQDEQRMMSVAAACIIRSSREPDLVHQWLVFLHKRWPPAGIGGFGTQPLQRNAEGKRGLEKCRSAKVHERE